MNRPRREDWIIRVGSVALLGLLLFVVGCDREALDPEEGLQVGDEAETLRGSHQYSLRVDDSQLEVGSPGELQVEVHPTEDLKINLEFPWSIEFDDGQDFTIDTEPMRGEEMDLTEERALITVPFEAGNAMEYQVSARADFSVCNDDRCYIFSDEAIDMTVHAAPQAEQ